MRLKCRRRAGVASGKWFNENLPVLPEGKPRSQCVVKIFPAESGAPAIPETSHANQHGRVGKGTTNICPAIPGNICLQSFAVATTQVTYVQWLATAAERSSQRQNTRTNLAWSRGRQRPRPTSSWRRWTAVERLSRTAKLLPGQFGRGVVLVAPGAPAQRHPAHLLTPCHGLGGEGDGAAGATVRSGGHIN